MNNYDRINVPNFKDGKQNGYLCSMCGQYTSLNESISHQGWNLVCNRCEWKMRSLLRPYDVSLISTIQKVGKEREEEEDDGRKES